MSCHVKQTYHNDSQIHSLWTVHGMVYWVSYNCIELQNSYSAESWFLNIEFLCCFVLGFWQVTSLSCDITYSFHDNTGVASSDLITMLFPTVNQNNYKLSASARKDLWNLIESWQFEKCNALVCVLETDGSYRNRNIIWFKNLSNYVILELVQVGYKIISRLGNEKEILKSKAQVSFFQCSNWYRSTNKYTAWPFLPSL